jgi:hypothetical protein
MMKTPAARWLFSPLTSYRAVRRMRAGEFASFDDAWIHTRLAAHPEELAFVKGARAEQSTRHSGPEIG